MLDFYRSLSRRGELHKMYGEIGGPSVDFSLILTLFKGSQSVAAISASCVLFEKRSRRSANTFKGPRLTKVNYAEGNRGSLYTRPPPTNGTRSELGHDWLLCSDMI